ncbi:DUF3298 and DUF4163 domain-containing protein [Paenibacillus eucommiae]|uniref:DUF3298/DUF4163 domain-containing protein n=1 Tax=Paenibacillus eucommiae TaxID=1355755 RepID=A0ABS4J916_9BACL|nr:DUF3298 and DUF4163 domain-containing protein [Paenibacillus eucommiae]MBP1996334.1 hypothetical protein [Paenibacillus eucommiae]
MDGIQLPLSIATYRITAPKLNVLYPVIKAPMPPGGSHINRVIVEQVHQLIKDQGYGQNPQTESSGYYELKTNQRQILSLSLYNYAFSGGAHGLVLQKSLTFDSQTGKSYALSGLFKPGADYVKRLSEIVAAQIKERDIPLLVPFTGIRPDQDYYIADKALVIYFAVYEITAYVYQFPYFPISVYSIQDIIDENGPLGKMMY